MEVSAKSGTGVKEAFMAVATRAVGEKLAQGAMRAHARGAGATRTMRKVWAPRPMPGMVCSRSIPSAPPGERRLQ